ncbi:hypothetical protein B0H19DRAFT_1277292 [Mycena capillaripes]|nr:hypothetical protein B0H19DRAFT_1277292 [Mycena capillaripes]
MLWLPLIRQTRSGREFTGVPRQVIALQAPEFDFAPFVEGAVNAEGPGQEDHEEDDVSHKHQDALDNEVDNDWLPADSLEGVDDIWPLPPSPPSPPPPDPLNEVDDVNPSLPPRKRRQYASPTFAEVVASAEIPHTGPHRHRPAKPHRLAKKHADDNVHRKAKCAKRKQELGHAPTASTIREHIQPAVLPPPASIHPCSPRRSARMPRRRNPDKKFGSKVCRSLPNLLGLGFHLIKWDGVTSQPIIDSLGRIIVVLAGQPNNAGYREAAGRAFHAIRNAGSEARFPASMRRHCRGLFAAITEYTDLAEGLLANSDIGRLAGFSDAAFALWAPCLHAHYRECDTELRHAHPHLRRPFPNSAFFAATFNFGPKAWTFKHRDILNLVRASRPVGLEARHRFSPGTLILLPSATITHSNVPVDIKSGEERASFTQFSAGGIFRYVDNGCQTVAQLEESNPAEYGRLMLLKAPRWEKGLGLFSTMDELLTTTQ